MTHNVDQTTGQAAYFGVREDPWHQLGTTVPDYVSVEEALKISHADYEVEKVPVFAEVGEQKILVPGKFATVRRDTDAPLGIVGPDYTVVQMRENADFLEAVIDNGDLKIETAGALDEGRRTFVSMKAPKGLLIAGRDAIDLNLVALNSYDGSSPFRVLATPTRVVCQNTEQAAIRNAQASVSIRHTRNATKRVEEAQKALQIGWNFWEAFEAGAEKMAAEAMTNGEFDRFITDLFGEVDADASVRSRNYAEKRETDLRHLFREAETQENCRGTRWAAYNAVTEYVDWFLPAKGGDVARAERTAISPWASARKSEAFNALVSA